MTHDDAFVMNFSENSNNWYNQMNFEYYEVLYKY